VRLWLDSKRAAQRYQITGQPTTNVPVRREQRQRFSLRDDQILELARYAVVIEEHYSAMAGEERPMDIEWALDGADGNLYVVQVGGRLGRRAGRKRRASEAGCRGSRWSKERHLLSGWWLSGAAHPQLEVPQREHLTSCRSN
jgi:phosphoenolpyruvate synthase/pyruvate phosphate dikinase